MKDTASKRKTIALVTNTTWNIYNFRQNLIDKFIKEGFEVVVIAPIDEYIHYKEKYPEVRHFNLRMMDRDGMNPFKDFLMILELIRKYRKARPDIVLHFTNKPNIFGGMAAWLAGVKSIAVVTGLGYAFINKGITRRIIQYLYKWTAPFHRKFIFENTEDRQLFGHLKIVPTSRSVSVKGCGVNTLDFAPRTVAIENDKLVFTFIGRMLYDKGIREFVEAARIVKSKYNKVEFWIIGELDAKNPATMDKDELVRWVEEKIVNYHGFLKDVRPAIAESSCIVLPTYREGMPRVVTEAMSMAKPVITTDTAGCRETVVDGVNGYIVKVKDVQGLVDAMEKFIKLDDSEKKDMGIKGRQKAISEFDDKIIATDIYSIVTDVLNEGK